LLPEGDDDLRGRDTLELDVHRQLEVFHAVADDGGLGRGDVATVGQASGRKSR
jgi:hypothetical protein